ncbi:MAG: hypothetical protein KF819_40540 [Labilithrix sp.]|nr:hypothetical protein [Labilithrix sp.]
MRRRPFLRRPGIGVVGLVVFVVAFAVRAWWAIRVQRPIDAVWSDMAGYVHRAELLLSGQTPGDPRVLALWPWGTHAIVAGEIALFGRSSVIGIGLCHAVVGAIAAPCAAALAARFVPGRLAALVAGLAVALWHPHVVYGGYFSSEIWFASVSLLATLFLVRHAEGRRGAVAGGLFLAIAFVIRPQVLLTCAIVGAVIVVARFRGRRLLPLSPGALAALLIPLGIVMAASSVRLHRLTGRWGTIAAYEPVQRLFGATDVAKVESTWTAPNGDRWTWWFNPTTKGIPTPATTERFEGFIADPELIRAIQERRLEGVGSRTRLARMVDNVLLLVDNVPWPEKDNPVRVRRLLQKNYKGALFVVLALALFGVWPLRRRPLPGLLVGGQLATIVLVAALYLGEARYRVPYDPLLIVVAVVGLWTLGGLAVRKIRDARARVP